MENTEIAKLARKIYQKHSRALDVILEYRPDALQSLTDAMAERLKAEAATLDLIPMLMQKGYVRFLPKAWDTEPNRRGTAWGQGESAYVLCEIVLWGKNPILKMIEGKAPEKWRNELWAISRNEPFVNTQKRSKQPAKWMGIYSVKNRQSLEDLESQAIDELADELWKWFKQEFAEEKFKKSIVVVADHLKTLLLTPSKP